MKIAVFLPFRLIFRGKYLIFAFLIIILTVLALFAQNITHNLALFCAISGGILGSIYAVEAVIHRHAKSANWKKASMRRPSDTV